MFGHESQPSRIYAYGAKAPVVNGERVGEQIWLGHRYRNTLAEIELRRREQTDKMVVTLSPELPGVEAKLLEADQAIESAAAEIKLANKQARRQKATPEQKTKLAALRKERAALRKKRKALRDVVFSDSGTHDALTGIDQRAAAEQREARAESGLYWGTYLTVEQGCQSFRKGRPPRFLRWTGEGRIAVQVQGGLAPEDAFGGEDKRLIVEPLPEDAWSKRSRGLKRTKAWLRIGSDDDRQPVWAVVPFVMHRSLPADCRIKWVYLHRRRVGTKDQWMLSFVIARQVWPQTDVAGSGEIGIDLGWRLLDHGLRVAAWAGSDGESGELVLPIQDVGRWQKAQDLRGIRDTRLDAVIARFGEWLSGNDAPDWLTERTRTLRQWRSAARLASVVLAWRDQRFAGDESIYADLEAWRKKDKHLYEWEANQRRKAVAWLKDLYRNFAAAMARRYRVAVLEAVNWRDMGRRAGVGESDKAGAARRQRVIASPGRLAECIRERFADCVSAPAEYTTQRCHACGEIDGFDARVEIVHTCGKCGKTWDQDYNAARNLLAFASGPVAKKTR